MENSNTTSIKRIPHTKEENTPAVTTIDEVAVNTPIPNTPRKNPNTTHNTHQQQQKQQLSGKNKYIKETGFSFCQYKEYISRAMKSSKARNFVLIFFAIVTTALLAAVYATRGVHEPNDPNTWTTNELKEWLAEHRTRYYGTPEKQELVDLVKSNWSKNAIKGEEKSTVDHAKDFVNYYVDYIKDRYTDNEEVAADKLDDFTRDIADSIESLRQSTGLTEEQINSTFDQIKSRIGYTKNKSVGNALDQVQKSYYNAKDQRDRIIDEATNRIQKDYQKSKNLSKDTVNWFHDEIQKMSSTTGFAAARTETQTALILQGIQEELVNKKVMTIEQVKGIYAQLNSAVQEYYKDVEGTLAKVRNEIQYALNQFSQKIGEGKNVTIDQFNEVVQTINRYLFYPIKGTYDSSTNQVRDTTYHVRDVSQEQLNNIAETVRKAFAPKPETPKDKLSHVIESMEQQLMATQQLSREQTEIVRETIRNQFDNIKDAREVTEDKVNAFIAELSKKFSETSQSAKDNVLFATDKVKENIQYATAKVKEEL
ncbi:7702_t:CDS:2 [Ambispora gerdemannii]|uniref:7702_t:CDS:1 n=1 Tax=Ambispora gerdemannii TaxID=144530 RepID=A0A9N8V362_9GLOM|nr:7702_t:CDS:2 [Ambispora gerdemannii]